MAAEERGTRGYFSIGVYHPKTVHNIGTLWRSAYQLGAVEIFTISARWPKKQASDTLKTYRSVPYRKYSSVDELIENLPYGCPLIGVETDRCNLTKYAHRERACYLLGAEDHGLPGRVLSLCHNLVSIPSIRTNSYNVAVAGAIVMYDRMSKELMK